VSSAKSPVHFESVGLKGLREKGMVELSQDVLVTQDEMRLESDYAQVFFDEASHEVTKVVAQGRVRINGVDQNSGEKFRALGDRAVFLNGERTVVLDGNAKLWRGEDSVIRSKKITYEMNTGWIRADRVAGEVQTENRNTESSKKQSNSVRNTEKRK
jgi:lipopolysaccharide transport protein LptA